MSRGKTRNQKKKRRHNKANEFQGMTSIATHPEGKKKPSRQGTTKALKWEKKLMKRTQALNRIHNTTQYINSCVPSFDR
jgi:hypothetical protein